MSQPGVRQKDKLGVVSLILGLVALITSWVLIGFFFGFAAVLTGAIGRSRAKRGLAAGSGAATAGVILGAVAMVAALIAVASYSWIYHHPPEQPPRVCKVYDTYQRC